MTKEKAEMLNKIKVKMLHFAWDNYEMITFEKLKEFRPYFKFQTRQLGVYMLVGFNTTLEEDLDRIYKLRKLGYTPYVMRFKDYNTSNKKLERGNIYNKLARWCNNKVMWNSNNTFEEYLERMEAQNKRSKKEN